MLTDRGRFALAVGGGAYLAGWAFGSEPLYPVAVGLVLAVLAAWLWVKLVGRPGRLRRTVRGGAHVAGDDVPIGLELDLDGRVTPTRLTAIERIERLGEREIELTRNGRVLRGDYVIQSVPRGRYPIEPTEVVVEDALGLNRNAASLAAPGALIVYPRLVELDRLFSETGLRMQEGRRLLLRRPSGFDLHSVREHEQGESLRRVHWPTTARRGQLMVKDLEDSPRDEVLVVLDAEATYATGEPPDAAFEVSVSAAGSVLRAHAGRGRRAGIVVNMLEPRYQAVHTLDGDWEVALDLLASVEPNGRTPVAAMLAEGAGAVSQAVDLCIVTSGLTPRLVDRLMQRSVSRRASSVVYVDPTSFAGEDPGAPLAPELRAQVGRLELAGVAVCVLRRGDDLEDKLGAGLAPARQEAVVG